jgi:hypothetical protein
MNHPIYVIDHAGQYREASYLSTEETYLAAAEWVSIATDICPVAPPPRLPLFGNEPLAPKIIQTIKPIREGDF